MGKWLVATSAFVLISGIASGQGLPCGKEAQASFSLSDKQMTYQGDECFASSRAFCDCDVHAYPVKRFDIDEYENCLMRSAVECHENEEAEWIRAH